MKTNRLVLLFASMAWMLVACTSTAPQAITPTSAYQAPVTQGPPVGPDVTEPPNPLNIENQLAQVDAILQQSTQASIAFNAPSEMRVDETVTIELLLNPSLSPDDQYKRPHRSLGPVRSISSDHFEKQLDGLRLEVPAGLITDVSQRLSPGPGRAVGTVGSECVPNIDDGE